MSHSSWIGKKLGGRYEIVSELGSGGMSTVYKANDPNLGRVVAIKIIHHHLTTNEDFVRRFRDEAAVVAQLRHPNIVQVYDFNSDDDVYFIVFEFVPGVTLQDHLKRLNELQRRVSVDEIIKYTQQIGSALDYAHGRGLVHRDIKPANVMINVYGDAILTDFGIAKIMDSTHHTATGAVLGTARYMSPEQIKGQTVDGRSDTYSLGVMLYEMASGFPPYDAESVMTILMMHVNDPIPRLPKLDLPGGLNDCIETAMAKEPEDRYQTLAELSADLNRLDELDRFDHTAQEKTEDISNTIAYQSIPQVGDPAVDSTMVDQPTVPSGGTGVTTGRLPAQPVTPAGQTVDGGDGDRSLFRSPLVWLGGGIAAILLVGLIFMAGRLSGGGGTNVEAMTPQAVSGQSAAPDDEEAEPVATETEEATISPTDTSEPTETATSEPTSTSTSSPTPRPTNTPQPSSTPTELPPTVTALPTNTPLPPTPTAAPPPTETPAPVVNSTFINSISIDGDRYVVDYGTAGFTETLPGQHVHFYWNNIREDQAGVGPTQASWILYGGPRPFTGYAVNDRPGDATQMCIIVANPDHTILLGTGNCFPLP